MTKISECLCTIPVWSIPLHNQFKCNNFQHKDFTNREYIFLFDTLSCEFSPDCTNLILSEQVITSDFLDVKEVTKKNEWNCRVSSKE